MLGQKIFLADFLDQMAQNTQVQLFIARFTWIKTCETKPGFEKNISSHQDNVSAYKEVLTWELLKNLKHKQYLNKLQMVPKAIIKKLIFNRPHGSAYMKTESARLRNSSLNQLPLLHHSTNISDIDQDKKDEIKPFTETEITAK